MNALQIVPIKTPRERLKFIHMPWSLYEGDPHWVPPIIADQKAYLDPKRGVFFDHGEAELFLALRGGLAVGRVSAHVNDLYNQYHDEPKGFFGFFECENNQETAGALLRAVEQYHRGKGKKIVEGPLSFGIYDEVGVLVDGFDTDPYVLNVHNPPYYRELLEGAGFVKAIDWYAYRGFTDGPVEEKLFRARQRVLETPGFVLRNLDLKNVKREAAIVKGIFDTAWMENWGHVPLTEREYQRIVREMLKFAVPELSFIAEVEGQPVGFGLTVYDANVAVKKINGRLFPFGFIVLLANLKRTDRARHILMGIRKEYRNRGIETAIYASIAEQAHALGFREIEMSLIVEDNLSMRQSLKHLPVTIYKTYRIFQKEIA